MKILHIITGLNGGGAEMMLYRIIKHSPNPADHRVVSLLSGGIFYRKIKDLGCIVESLDMTKNPLTFSPFRLLRIIKDARPDAIQCWMFHANIIGGFFGRLAGVKNIVWGIHHTMTKHDRKISHVINKICALMSYNFCKTVICCGLRPLELCKQTGYCQKKLKCVFNGFESDSFFYDSEGRSKIRKEFGIPEDSFVVLNMAAYRPQKNHEGVLRIFSKLCKKNKNSWLILAGSDIKKEGRLADISKKLGIDEKIVFAGYRTDTRALYSAADVVILASFTEGFPNVIGEAMLCEKVFLSTDVGDCAYMFGHRDWAFELSDEDGFAEKLFEFSKMPESELKACGQECRKRIVDNFGIEKIYGEYAETWRE